MTVPPPSAAEPPAADAEPKVGATLLLDAPAVPDLAQLVECLAPLFPIGPAEAAAGSAGASFALPAHGGLLMGIGIDQPFPHALDGPARYAHWWPTALDDLATHRAHLFVTCPWAGTSRLDAHVRHLAVVCQLAEQLPVIGVLWGSVLVSRDQLMVHMAGLLQGQLPIRLFVLVQYGHQADGKALVSTLGLRDFGLMEIETVSPLPLEETYGIVERMAAYLIQSGPVVRDRDTVGVTPEQQLLVRHAASFRPDVPGMVYRLEIAPPPAP